MFDLIFQVSITLFDHLTALKKLYGDKLDNLPFKLHYEILEGYGHNVMSLDLLQKIALFLMT